MSTASQRRQRALILVDTHTEVGAFARLGQLIHEYVSEGDERTAAEYRAIREELRIITGLRTPVRQ